MLKLPAIFSDHMILQRRKPVVIWGESDAKKVTVTIQDARVVTYVQDGKWQLFLPPMEAGGPYVLTVKTDEEEEKVYEDVMYGEIWRTVQYGTGASEFQEWSCCCDRGAQ